MSPSQSSQFTGRPPRSFLLPFSQPTHLLSCPLLSCPLLPSNDLLLPRLRSDPQFLPQHIRQARPIPQIHPILILASLLLVHRRAQNHEIEPLRPAYGRGEPDLLVGWLFVEDVGSGGGCLDCEDAGLVGELVGGCLHGRGCEQRGREWRRGRGRRRDGMRLEWKSMYTRPQCEA